MVVGRRWWCRRWGGTQGVPRGARVVLLGLLCSSAGILGLVGWRWRGWRLGLSLCGGLRILWRRDILVILEVFVVWKIIDVRRGLTRSHVSILVGRLFRRAGGILVLGVFVIRKIILVRSWLTLSGIFLLVGRSFNGRRRGRHLGCPNSPRNLVHGRSEEPGLRKEVS